MQCGGLSLASPTSSPPDLSSSSNPATPCSFDLLHVMIDEPDAHLDQQIANHILRSVAAQGV